MSSIDNNISDHRTVFIDDFNNETIKKYIKVVKWSFNETVVSEFRNALHTETYAPIYGYPDINQDSIYL